MTNINEKRPIGPQLVKLSNDHSRARRFEMEGHTEHCARRIVWGDGECECGKAAGFDVESEEA